MNGISHKQARRYMQADLDGLLSDTQRFDLETHLAGCETCRAESETLSTLTSRLQGEFHERWDAQDGPSQNVITNVRSQTRRIIMSNRINFGLRAIAGIALLLVLGLGLNAVILQMRDHSTAASRTTAPDNNMPVSTRPEDRLLAFTKIEDGNYDIYTIHADGSKLVNLTNNPAYNANPFWSPDGKLIAFESNRTGSMQIFLMNADGSDIVQLTNEAADHKLPYNLDGRANPWSPDGSRLLFLQQNPNKETWTLNSLNIDDGSRELIVKGRISFNDISWSPDGSRFGFVLNDPQNTDIDDFVPVIYIAHAKGGSPWAVTDFLQQKEQLSDPSYTWSPDSSRIAYIIRKQSRDLNLARIYVTDVNSGIATNITSLLPDDEDLYSPNYAWTREGNIRFIAGRTAWENNNRKFAFYEATLDGKTLVEITRTSTPLEDWWNGTTLVRSFSGETLTWLHSDGTYSEFKPYEKCQMDSEEQYFGFSKRSSTGYLLYAAGCPNGDWWLIWANRDGTNIKQLLKSPIKATTPGGLNDINWSPDGEYAALTLDSSGVAYLYILNFREAIENPLTQFESIPLGRSDINYGVSWQPMP